MIPVSVAIPCYNSHRTIERCVESINNGSSIPREIVISYDKSTDGTWDLLVSISKRHKNVFLIRNTGKRGAAANRNNAIENCSSEVITHLDADDTMAKYKLEREYDLIKQGNRVAFSDYLIIFPYFMLGSRVKFHSFYHSLKSNKLTTECLIHRVYGVPRDLMFYKDDFSKVGKFDTQLEMYEDLDFKVKLYLETRKWGYTNVVGTNYYQINGSLSRQSNLKKIKYVEKIKERYSIQNMGSYIQKSSRIEKSFINYFLTRAKLLK